MTLLRITFGDLRLFLKDLRAALWLIAMPLAFAYIFGSANLGGGGTRATWIPVIDLDHTELSALFIEQLRQPGYQVEPQPPSAQAELKTKWPYGLIIPAGFAHSILEGTPVKARLVKGHVPPDVLLEVQSCLVRALVHYTGALALADVIHKPWNTERKAALEQALQRPQLLSVATRSDNSLHPPPVGFNQSLPGMLAMFVVQMIIIYGGTNLVRDRVGGQLKRLLASPARTVEVYSAKAFSRVLLGLLQAGSLLVCGALLFHLPLGQHPLFLAPVVLSLALFAGSLSILVGMACQTEKQVILAAIFCAMVLSALGGCWWPIEVVPDAFKTIAEATPTYWAVHGLQSVLYFGKSYQVLTLEVPILLGFALFFGALAALLCRRA